MARQQGTTNQGYDDKRVALLMRLEPRLLTSTEERASFREMAALANVSVPTLRHYFTNREGVITAFLAHKSQMGAPYLERMQKADAEFSASILSLVHDLVYGFTKGAVINLHVVGLTEGLASSNLGPAYLHSLFEPSLAAIESRLSQHIALGEMLDVEVRTAALGLLSPVILAVLHQHCLGGLDLRYLDLEQFAKNHSAAFIRAFANLAMQ